MPTLLDENKQWLDSNNSLVVDGYIFIGTQGQDPTLGYPDAPVNLIAIFSDPELSIPLSNPQRTNASGKSDNKIWIPSTEYAYTVWDSEGNQVETDLNAGSDGLNGNHYDTLALAVADINMIEIGDVLVIGGRTTKGDGGEATWDAVDATTVTENEYDIVTGSATISLQLRMGYRTNPKALGAVGDALVNDTAVFTYMETLTDNDIRLPQGTYIVNGIVLAKRYLGPGIIRLDGVDQGSNSTLDSLTLNGSLYLKKGADIASANDAVLLADGNYNDITGTTTINGFTDGVVNEVRKFHTDAVTTLKHNTAASAGFSSLWLPGEVDLATTANLELEFTYDGTLWRLTNVLRDLYIPTQHGGDYIKLSDVKSAGTAGGTFTAAGWRTRVLNTEDSDTGGYCTLASDQFTLNAGTYRIAVTAIAFSVNEHRIKLHNASDTADIIIGNSANSAAVTSSSTTAALSGQFTIASSKAFEIQHYCNSTRPSDGFGQALNAVVDEVYTIVELWKVK